MPAKKKEVEKVVKELSPIDKLIQEYADQKKKAQERLDKLRKIQDDVKDFERKLELLDKKIAEAKKEGIPRTKFDISSNFSYFVSVQFGVRELEMMKEDTIKEFEQASAFLASIVAKMEETPDAPQI